MNRLPRRGKGLIRYSIVLGLLFVTMPGSSVLSQALMSKQQILAPIQSGVEGNHPLELKWEATEQTSESATLMVSIHDSPSPEEHDQRAGIYLQVKNKFKILKQIETSGYFLQPNFFRAQNDLFLQISEVQMGTGNEKTEHIYYILPVGGIKKVSFIPAPQSFAGHLKDGELIRKGENNRLTDNGLFFEFSVWNPGDANCCPSAGRVKGTYALKCIDPVKNEFQITMDMFTRIPM